MMSTSHITRCRELDLRTRTTQYNIPFETRHGKQTRTRMTQGRANEQNKRPSIHQRTTAVRLSCLWTLLLLVLVYIVAVTHPAWSIEPSHTIPVVNEPTDPVNAPIVSRDAIQETITAFFNEEPRPIKTDVVHPASLPATIRFKSGDHVRVKFGVPEKSSLSLVVTNVEVETANAVCVKANFTEWKMDSVPYGFFSQDSLVFRSPSLEEILNFAESYKVRGNAYFQAQNFDAASECYIGCTSILHVLTTMNSYRFYEPGLKRIVQLRTLVLSNLAQCFLNMTPPKFEFAYSAAAEGLQLARSQGDDAQTTKLLFRRGCASFGLKKWEDAVQDLSTPSLAENKAAQSKLKHAQHYAEVEKKRQEQRDRALWAGAFKKNSETPSQNVDAAISVLEQGAPSQSSPSSSSTAASSKGVNSLFAKTKPLSTLVPSKRAASTSHKKPKKSVSFKDQQKEGIEEEGDDEEEEDEDDDSDGSPGLSWAVVGGLALAAAGAAFLGSRRGASVLSGVKTWFK